MKRFRVRNVLKVALVEILICLQLLPGGCAPPSTEKPLTEQTDDFQGSVTFSADQLTPFQLAGTEPDIGAYTARGEVTFEPGSDADTLVGTGVADFQTTNGDHLVANVTWTAGPEIDGKRASNIRFSWRDSVQFNDGTVVTSTGQFADAANRPPGLVVIAIIAILIGLLVPAVQK